MNEEEDEEYVNCAYCGDEISEDEAIYVEGRPYCEECYTEAEAFIDEGEEDD